MKVFFSHKLMKVLPQFFMRMDEGKQSKAQFSNYLDENDT